MAAPPCQIRQPEQHVLHFVCKVVEVEAMLGVATQPAKNPGIPGSEGLLHSGTSGKVTQPTEVLVFEALRRVMKV